MHLRSIVEYNLDKIAFKAFIQLHWRDNYWLSCKHLVRDFFDANNMKYNREYCRELSNICKSFFRKLKEEGKIEQYSTRVWRIKNE